MPQARIVTISGVSGSGKSTIVTAQLNWLYSRVELLLSTTTRKPRPTDLGGEYEYLKPGEFGLLQKTGQLIWSVEVTGEQYGTKKSVVSEVFKKGAKAGIMILTPDTVALLKLFVEKRCAASHLVKSAYIIPPSKEILAERMRKRGDSEEQIARRILQADEWKKWEKSYGIFDAFIRNDEEDPLATRASEEFRKLILS